MKARDLLPAPSNIVWSLLFAVVVWFIADGRVRLSRDGIPVRLVFEAPAGYAFKYADTGTRDPPPVTVTVTGPRQAFDRMPDVVRATYRWDADKGTEGARTTLPISDFQLDLGSPELSEDESSFSLRSVELVVSKVARRELRVDWQLATSTVPAGWQVPADQVRVEPSLVEATGPERDFESAVALGTEPIEVGRRLLAVGWRPQGTRPQTLTIERVRLRPPKGTAIEPVDPFVRVVLTVQPESVDIELKSVEPAIAVEPFFDLERYRIEVRQGLNLVDLKLRGPKALLGDERALREQLKVYAVLSKKSHELRPIAPGRLRPLDIVVYPPAGVEWLNRADDFRFQVTVEEVARASGGGGG